MTSKPTWRQGPPDSAGIWLVEFRNGSLVVAKVEWEQHESELRVLIDAESWALDDPENDVNRFGVWSYGPIEPRTR